jgi:iron complex transport system substrate-binding protein
MRVFACALAISLVLAPITSAEAEAKTAPMRIASLNLCTDELLMMLARPEQIVSVTWLSRQSAESPFWQAAQKYHRNDGSLLSVAALKPDLVLGMGGGARDRAHIARRLGISTLDLPYPQNLADIEAGVRQVAEAVGRTEAGKRLADQIRQLRRTEPAHKTDTIWLGGGGRSVAANGLAAEWMRLAGFRQRNIRGDRVSLEYMLVSPPSILLRSDYRQGQYSGEQRWLSHPFVRGRSKARTIMTDGRRWTCMGPLMIAEIARLRQEAVR